MVDLVLSTPNTGTPALDLVLGGDTGAGVDLVFELPPVAAGPVNLVFGDDGMVVVPPPVSVTSTALLPAPTVSITVATLSFVSSAAILPPLTYNIAVRYDTTTDRPVAAATATNWHPATAARSGVGLGWQTAVSTSAAVAVCHQDADPLCVAVQFAHNDAGHVPLQVASKHQDALPAMPGALSFTQQDGIRLPTSITAHHQNAEPLRTVATGFLQQDGIHAPRSTTARWQPALPRPREFDAGFQKALAFAKGWGERHQDAWTPRPGAWARPVPPGPVPCYIVPPGSNVPLLFATPWTADNGLVFVCETHDTGPITPSAPIQLLPARFYVTINSIELRRIDGNLELFAYAFSMSLDSESWTWTFNAVLGKDALPSLQPGNSGDPVDLDAKINGVHYRLQVEKIGRDTGFASTRIRISGRGRAAILAPPYAPTMHFANAVDRTAQQLMADVLTVNGVSMGWDVDWRLTDWLVLAGAWTFQGSYIDAINDIATAAGGYVQPHPTEATLRILPRYPAAPWAWGTVIPDIELPAAVAEVESIEWIDKPAYNRVFVGGVSKGVFGPFTRTGTAGDLTAPQVTHPLITHADAHRQRGLAELSNTGRQAHVELKMQVLAETGIIVPGQFVRYVGDSTRMGIVRSTSVEWAWPALRQTIGIETHVA